MWAIYAHGNGDRVISWRATAHLEAEGLVVLEQLQDPRDGLPDVLGAEGDGGVQQAALVLQSVLNTSENNANKIIIK